MPPPRVSVQLGGTGFPTRQPLCELVLAYLNACEAPHLRVAAERLYKRVDRHLVVLDERLVEQRTALTLEEAGHLALDDLGPRLLGLALFARLLLVECALGLHHVRGELVARHVAGRGALVGDVQRNVMRDLARL